MTVSRKLKEYLDSRGVKYEVLSHKVAYTAQETAAAQRITGWNVAKCVVCFCDGKFLLFVLQAPTVIDFARLKKSLGCQEARLASEQEMEQLFPETELGAESPFGDLYGLPVFIDKGLTEIEEIIFNAGSHTEAIRMKMDDYRKLANPKIVEMGKPAKV